LFWPPDRLTLWIFLIFCQRERERERERESRCCWADRRSAFLVQAPLLLYFFQFRIGPTMGRTYWATTKPNDWQSQILESKTPLDQISCSFIQEQGTNRGRPNTLGWHKKYSWDPKTIELSVVKSPCLHPVFGPAFTPLSPLSVVSAKQWNFIKSH
jgi:hypothetical protein